VPSWAGWRSTPNASPPASPSPGCRCTDSRPFPRPDDRRPSR
jgi:hypothetical protein